MEGFIQLKTTIYCVVQHAETLKNGLEIVIVAAINLCYTTLKAYFLHSFASPFE